MEPQQPSPSKMEEERRESDREAEDDIVEEDELPAGEQFQPPEEENFEELEKMRQQRQQKQRVAARIKKESAPAAQSVEQQMDTLLKQAEYYANFLLSHHESAKHKNAQNRTKRRGRYDQEEAEERQMLEEEEVDGGSTHTHLSRQPSILAGGELKPYQMVGLNWLISLYESGINSILADDMGLGKTIQTISIIAFLRQYKKINGPHLVIAPKITLGNWVREFQKWLPCCRVVKLIATKEQREPILEEYICRGKFDVVVTSFEGARICLKYLRKIRWRYLIIDEAHKIKNEESMLSQVVRSLDTNFKLLLTGTPLQNNLHELWSLLNFILPDIFDSSTLFDTWFSANTDRKEEISKQELEQKNISMIQQLHKILRPFMLRRTKKEVEKTLPEKKEIHIYVGLTETQVRIYKSLLQKRNCSDDEKKFYLNLLMQLRKVCNHPYLFQGIEEEGSPALGDHIINVSGKMIVLDQLLRKLLDEKHQVLIFSQMTMVLDILEDYCNYRRFKYCRIDGSTDMDSRDRQINEFMTEGTDKFVFLLSTRAGGLGINLTAADTVIIYDSDWNPQMDLQAMDRAHRIGQKNKVNVYRLISQNTVEEKIIERQTIKLKWDSLVIQQGRMASQKNKILSRDQMKDMLQFGASAIFKADTTNGTMSEEKIEQLLARGESRTNQLNEEIEKKIKQQTTALDLGMSSINIFDYFIDNNKENQEIIEDAINKELQNQVRARRDKKGAESGSKADKQRLVKKIIVPEHHFYDCKDELTELMQKQEDYQTLKIYDSTLQPPSEEERTRKEELLQTGFLSWSKNDFQNFIQYCEKYGRQSLHEIAEGVQKPLQEVTRYSKIFWKRIEELSEKDRIKKAVQQGEDRIAARKHNQELLQWKSTQSYQIDFNQTIYTKFRSKLFTLEADRFLVQMLHKFGVNNFAAVKEKIRQEPIFRFDNFFKSRSESELNKRVQSLYKLLEKEREIALNGFDLSSLRDKESKKERKAAKLRDKDQQYGERLLKSQQSVEEIKGMNGRTNGHRRKDQARITEQINIEDDDQ